MTMLAEDQKTALKDGERAIPDDAPTVRMSMDSLFSGGLRVIPPPGPPQQSKREVARKTRAGVVWSVGSGVLTRAIGLFTTLLLTRYMTPDQSGAVNVALTLVTTVSIMTTVGLGQYVASQRHPSPRVAWNAMVLHVSLGLVAFAGTLLFSHPLARLFGATLGARFIPLLVLTFLLERISYVPERVLVAHMRFRQLSFMRSAGELSYCAGAVTAALLGYGPWCIVAGNLARQLLRLGFTFYFMRPGEWFVAEGPRKGELHALMRFGLPIMVASIAGFATRRWDNLLVAHYYGTDVLGLYNLAYNLAEVPAIQIAEMVAEVLAPSFARLDGDDRRKSAVDMVGALAICVFPLAIGLGLVAPTLSLLLPRRWVGMGGYLMVLSVLSLTRPVGMVLAVYLQALRKPMPAAALQMVMVCLLMGSLMLVGNLFPHNPVSVCYAVGATFTLGSALAVYLLWVIDRVPPWKLVWVQVLPAPALLTMALSVKGLDYLVHAAGFTVSPWARLGMEIAAGGMGFLLGAVVFLPGPVRRILKAAQAMRRQRQ
jgi:PST family polysaccharide transporter